MSEIKSLLVYFLKNSSKILGKTDLMKYLYCFEYYYVQTYGKQYSELNFTRYKFGPNTSQVSEAVNDLQNENLVTVFHNYLPNGRQFHGHEFNHSIPSDEYTLTKEAAEVAGFILNRLGHCKYEEVIEFAYSTPPMSYVLSLEAEQKISLHGRRLDLGMSKEIYKMSPERKAKARLRMEKREKVKGSDKEYYDEYLKTYSNFEDTRRRVQQCLN